MIFLCKMFDSTTRPIHTFKTIYAQLNEQLFLYTGSNLIILILITHRENSQAVIIYCVGCFPFTLEISVIKLCLESEDFSTPTGYRLESLILKIRKLLICPQIKSNWLFFKIRTIKVKYTSVNSNLGSYH